MNKLREIRSIRRVTQFQLRLSAGIHQSKISLIENGLIAAREDEKKKISKALGVKPEDIFPTPNETVPSTKSKLHRGQNDSRRG